MLSSSASSPLAAKDGASVGFVPPPEAEWWELRDGITAYGIAVIALIVLARYWLDSIIIVEVELTMFVILIVTIARLGGARAAMINAVVVAAATLAEMTNRESDFDEVVAGILLLTATAAIVMQFRQGSLARLAHADARAENALELADELSLLIESAQETAIYMLDPIGRVQIWNRGGQRMLGWTEQEAVGKHISEFEAPADFAGFNVAASLDQARAMGRVSYESRLRRKDGSEFEAVLELTALRDEAGNLRGFGKVVRDVTQERAASRAIERSEAYLRRLISAIPDALVVADQNGAILTFNQAAERMFGYEESELLGQNVSSLMQPTDAERHPDLLNRYVASGDTSINGMDRILTAMRRDGTTFPHSIVLEEVGSDSDRLFMGFIRDMTASQDAAAELAEMQAGLIHVSRLSAMGTMASTLAHELNQPITAVANYIGAANDLLKSSEPDQVPTVIEALEYAEADTMRAGRIIRQLRKFVARGHVEQAPSSLRAIINDAMMLATMDARNRNIKIHIGTRSLDFQVFVDKIQIQQVLVNLIRNAIEALESCVDRNLYISFRSETDDSVRVTVADSGDGVASTIAGDLFGAFATTKTDGMGVGLSICRTIVEANGGRIWYEPREGGGAQFHFTIKKAAALVAQDAGQ